MCRLEPVFLNHLVRVFPADGSLIDRADETGRGSIWMGDNADLAVQKRCIVARDHPDFHISGYEDFM